MGSEGTLGIITKVTLRLYGIPESVCACNNFLKLVSGAYPSTPRALHILSTVLYKFPKVLTRRIYVMILRASIFADHFLYSHELIWDSGVIF